MRISFVLVLAVLYATPQALAEEPENYLDTTGKFAGSYLCIGQAAGGASYDSTTKAWRSSTFNIAQSKFVVSIKTAGMKDFVSVTGKFPGMQYSVFVRPFGAPEAPCWAITSSEPTNNVALSRQGRLICRANVQDYTFNFGTLRYLTVYPYGFVDGADNNDNTPSIEIGLCSRID